MKEAVADGDGFVWVTLGSRLVREPGVKLCGRDTLRNLSNPKTETLPLGVEAERLEHRERRL